MRNSAPAPDHDVEFVGGALALDFTNTVGGTHTEPTHDHIRGFDDLVRFLLLARNVSEADARRLVMRAQRQPAEARKVVERAVALREAIWRVFSPLANDENPTAEDVALLRKEALRAAARAELAVAGGHGQWVWRVGEDLEYPVGALARSAVELLTTAEELSRLRECASETCQWLFLDRSKSRTRRWCDMRDCGNRAKARRVYEPATREQRRGPPPPPGGAFLPRPPRAPPPPRPLT